MILKASNTVHLIITNSLWIWKFNTTADQFLCPVSDVFSILFFIAVNHLCLFSLWGLGLILCQPILFRLCWSFCLLKRCQSSTQVSLPVSLSVCVCVALSLSFGSSVWMCQSVCVCLFACLCLSLCLPFRTRLTGHHCPCCFLNTSFCTFRSSGGSFRKWFGVHQQVWTHIIAGPSEPGVAPDVCALLQQLCGSACGCLSALPTTAHVVGALHFVPKQTRYHRDVCSFENWFRWRHISTVKKTSAYLVKTKVKMHFDHICCQFSDSKWQHLCSKLKNICDSVFANTHWNGWIFRARYCRFHPKVCVLDFICVCRYQQLCRKQMFLET